MNSRRTGSAYPDTHTGPIGSIFPRMHSSLDSGGAGPGTSRWRSLKCPGIRRRTSCLDRVKRNGRDADNASAPWWRSGLSVHPILVGVWGETVGITGLGHSIADCEVRGEAVLAANGDRMLPPEVCYEDARRTLDSKHHRNQAKALGCLQSILSPRSISCR
jgi:hypothetical protein